MPVFLDSVTFIWTQSQLRTVREFKRHEGILSEICKYQMTAKHCFNANMCFNYKELRLWWFDQVRQDLAAKNNI